MDHYIATMSTIIPLLIAVLPPVYRTQVINEGLFSLTNSPARFYPRSISYTAKNGIETQLAEDGKLVR
jgi:hypothetical protein